MQATRVIVVFHLQGVSETPKHSHGRSGGAEDGSREATNTVGEAAGSGQEADRLRPFPLPHN